MDHDPTDLVAQERATAAAEATRKRLSKRDSEDLRTVLSQVQGRRFVWGLLEQCGVFRTSYTGNNDTFFREGQRNVGLLVLNSIHASCPEKYELMLKESRADD